MLSLAATPRLVWCLVLWVSLVSVSVFAADGSSLQRTSMPTRSFQTVLSPALFFNITSGGLKGRSIGFVPSASGTALPVCSNPECTIDVRLMLPHVLDDVSACLTPWKKKNEFGQNYTGAFVLVRQSACTYTTYAYAMASGASGIIAYGCPAAAPFNCDTDLQDVFVLTSLAGTMVTISTADGDALVAELTALRSAAGSGGTLPDALTVRFKSTGAIAPSERKALIDIMTNTTMRDFGEGSGVPAVLPRWTLQVTHFTVCSTHSHTYAVC
jgi:hypothetical protein